VERLAGEYVGRLRELVESCRGGAGEQEAHGAYSPADFPQAGLNQEELNKLLLKISKAAGGK
jgi:hypothetical protein